MSDQDYDLEVINDCYQANNEQFINYGSVSLKDHSQMNYLNRSAPNINKLKGIQIYQQETDDFVMNSCERINIYGSHFYQVPEDVSYEQDSEDRPFQSEDIFDRIQDLNFENNFNGSLLENQYNQQHRNHELNFSLDSQFNFNLDIKANNNNFLTASSFTDRVSSSFVQGYSLSRSHQKNRGGSNSNRFLNQQYQNGIKLVQPSMLKDKNFMQKRKKFQPFKEYVQESNILGQILIQKNNISSQFCKQTQINKGETQIQKSMIKQKDFSVFGNKQKLLKKIDKLLFSKSNKKPQQLVRQRKLQHRQRKQLKTKKQHIVSFGKENKKSIQKMEIKRNSWQKLSQKKLPIQSDQKPFKRSNNQISLKNKVKPELSNKQQSKNITHKTNHNGSSIENQVICGEASQLLAELKQIYEQSKNYFFLNTDNQVIQDILSSQMSKQKRSLLNEIQKKIQQKEITLENDNKNLIQKVNLLEKKKSWLQKRLNSGPQEIQQSNDRGKQEDSAITNKQMSDQLQNVNLNGQKMFKNFDTMRKQMRNNFDFEKELGF